MHNSKLLELFRKLSSRNLSRFGEFLASPYFNKNRDNLLFYQYLHSYAPKFVHKDLSKEAIIKKIETGKPLNEKGVSYLMNQQLNLLKKFLTVEGLLADGFKENVVLLRELHKLQSKKNYKSERDKLRKQLEKDPYRDTNYYKKRSALLRLEYEHSDLYKRKYNPFLQVASDALTEYYQLEKLRYYLEMRSMEKWLNVSYEKPDLKYVLGESEHRDIAGSIYEKAIHLIENDNDITNFFELKKLLEENENVFPLQEFKQFFTLLLNFCTSRINRFNDKQFYLEYLEINKMLLKKGMLFEGGELAPWRYKNLITVGLKTGEKEWTWDFMHQYRGRLPKAYEENVFQYNLAQYYFQDKNYDKAQMSLMQTDFKDFLLNIDARCLLIRIYYESDQEELLFSYLEATRIFLIRNKLIDPQVKKQMQKFIEFTTKLAKIDRFTAKKLSPLKDKLPPANEIMHHDWVLKQIQLKEEGR